MVGGLDIAGVSPVEEADRRLMASPVEGSLGMRIAEVEDGVVRLRTPLPVGNSSQAGVGLTAALSVLSDTAGGLAVAMYQMAGLSGPTIELRVDHAAPPAEEAGWLISESVVSHEVGEACYATVRIWDDTDRLVARAQGHYVRPPHGASADWQLEQLAPARLGRPDALLAALEPGPDPFNWTLRASTALSNPRRQVHGGMLLTIGQLAQLRSQVAQVSADPAEASAMLRPLSVTIDYQRPVPSDDSEVVCRTSYARRGRRFRTLRSELVRADGRVAAVVTGLWTVASGAEPVRRR